MVRLKGVIWIFWFLFLIQHVLYVFTLKVSQVGLRFGYNQPSKLLPLKLSPQDLQVRTCLYNTITRQKEKFEPLVKDKVSFYSCGPTVYDYAHIGNFRAFLTYDLIKRWLKYCGYDVTHICNLTDVDDKIIIKMAKEGKSLQEITNKYSKAFFEDLEMLRIERANHYPRATEYIQKMIDMISQLLKDGYAYEENGSIYFNVKKSKNYGQLAQLEESELDEKMVTGAGDSGPNDRRGETDKRDPRDFALWKAFTVQDGDVKWQTSIGEGRPGWHIECSAMCHSLLGDTIDIHGGGIDLVFPHHTNEIAQTEAYTGVVHSQPFFSFSLLIFAIGKKFCNYWIHNGFVIINNEKMSKSLKNFKTLRDIVQSEFDARAFRYLVITSQYRNPLNFNEETFPAAKNSLKRIDKVIHRIIQLITQNNHASAIGDEQISFPLDDNDEIRSKIEQYQEEMELFFCDDLNTPRAMASFFQIVSVIERYLKQFNHDTNNISVEAKHLITLQYLLKKLGRFDEIFGFLFPQKSPNHSTDCNCSDSTAGKTSSSSPLTDIPEEVISLAQQRFQFKSEKKYSESDVLRQKILELGYVIKDKKEGYDLIRKD